MIDNPIPTTTAAPESQVSVDAQFAERWAVIAPSERCLVMLAVDAMQEGRFCKHRSKTVALVTL